MAQQQQQQKNGLSSRWRWSASKTKEESRFSRFLEHWWHFKAYALRAHLITFVFPAFYFHLVVRAENRPNTLRACRFFFSWSRYSVGALNVSFAWKILLFFRDLQYLSTNSIVECRYMRYICVWPCCSSAAIQVVAMLHMPSLCFELHHHRHRHRQRNSIVTILEPICDIKVHILAIAMVALKQNNKYTNNQPLWRLLCAFTGKMSRNFLLFSAHDTQQTKVEWEHDGN